ncbi:hypothetical protein P7M32_05995 [Bisgaard Taxon 10/6]|uniref:Uncharacterized protein n=1 Tax=Exercitatus varius TaxID=67857 RepID=A0ABT6ETD7_9PAST|nr:hypothetical protein [Exercitatus varius]MDG2938823.1 hypothetical protein [Exercitatus varius]MDG2945979.1 hypothetical protein [Exercitatus varius]
MAVSRFTGKTLNRLAFEPLGTKEKVWFTISDEPNEKYLLKMSRPNTGEHWSEYIACQLCVLLGIPCAEYEILPCETAESNVKRMAVVSANLIENGFMMIMGNEFLFQRFPEKYPTPEESKNSREKRHTVSMVKESLTSVLIKPAWNFPDYFMAFDVFCGYLLLDTLISNQDRHHENWAVLYEECSQLYYLCETYDHAASLGRELTPEKRHILLTSKDKGQQLSTFVNKARSELFEYETDKKPLLTIDALKLALSYQDNNVKTYWINKINYLTEYEIQEILNKIKDEIMDKETKEFVLRMILENKKRILENVN